MTTPLRHALRLHLVVTEETTVPVDAALTYDPTDPYAVSAVFHTDETTSVTWTFGRDLLLAGMTEPSGEGDVVVWPWQSDERPVVCLALSSPSGEALLEADLQDVRRFLDASYELLPAGRESEHLDVDSVIEHLLAH